MSHGILYNDLKRIKLRDALVRGARYVWERYRMIAWIGAGGAGA
jgi:hypothetical protein